MAFLSQIWRHPIKAHGREEITHIKLSEGRDMPWDRRWAVAHELSKFDIENPGWVPCANFARGAKAPKLQAITAQIDLPKQKVTLSHPLLKDLTIDPDSDADSGAFIQWVMRISPPDRALPARLVRAPQRGMTDTDYPSISLINLTSHAALAQHIGQEISPLRWRGNLILGGLEPWAELDWVGKRVRVGRAELEIREPITRCKMPNANTKTGAPDADILGGLNTGFGHHLMGVFGTVIKTGDIRQGDMVELI
ncbi:MAG: MOSC domain-containing protein [Paracoccaceae bacterium]